MCIVVNDYTIYKHLVVNDSVICKYNTLLVFTLWLIIPLFTRNVLDFKQQERRLFFKRIHVLFLKKIFLYRNSDYINYGVLVVHRN